jgi:hypothetical protein
VKLKSLGGEIGKHARLKILWPLGLAGSNPAPGTMPKKKLPYKEFTWTPNLAYAVGLIVSDGNLSNDGRHITLTSSEKKFIRVFKKSIGLTNKIGKSLGGNGNVSYRIQFSNVQFYNWLVDVGITPAKTYNIGEIDVPENYFKDFLRGHLDGDGSISVYIDKYNKYKGRIYTNQRLCVRFISASKKHAKWLQSMTRHILNLSGALIKGMPSNSKRCPMWILKFSKKESLKLLKEIYYSKTIPCLQRKRKKALEGIHLVNLEKRKKYKFIK